MKLFIATLFYSSVFASDCTVAQNFPSTLTIGAVYPITQVSQASPDGTLTTKISGSIVVLTPCSLQFKNLVLSNAPPSAQIQVYANQVLRSFPVSAQILSGNFANQDGPIITFSDTSVQQIPNSPGVAWKDINELVIFATSQSWVIAKIELPVPLVPIVQSVATSVVQITTGIATATNAPVFQTVRPLHVYPKVNSGGLGLMCCGFSIILGMLVLLML